MQNGESIYEEWLELDNGCLCCTVKDNGVVAIEKLMDKKGKFDYILLETTGIADPGPIANMFWLDEGLASNIYLDGIVTLMDATSIATALDEEDQPPPKDAEPLAGSVDYPHKGLSVANIQVAEADVLILNKCDKIAEARELESIKSKLSTINSLAPIYECSFGKINLSQILDLHCYEGKIPSSLNRATTTSGYTPSRKGNASHAHSISTVALGFGVTSSDQNSAIETWLQGVLWERPLGDIHRTKGRLVDAGGQVQVIQGVRDTYEIVATDDSFDVAASLNDKHNSPGKIVLIGKDIDPQKVLRSFEALDIPVRLL